MALREIRPKRNKSSSNRGSMVRASFSSVKSSGGYNLNLYIGKNVAQSFGFKDGDKISFNIDEDNPRIWVLKKSVDGVGYTLVDGSKNKTGEVLRLQLGWDEYEPDEKERPVREVKHGAGEGGLRIISI
ncbi:TPA: hypothetical protein F7082_14930 [Legionella pneumophila]|nr:hypothetical protein [Legionella pneumophila]